MTLVDCTTIGNPPQLDPDKAATIRVNIFDFLNRKEKKGEYFETRTMMAHGYPWKVRIYPRGDHKSDTDNVSCYLIYDSDAHDRKEFPVKAEAVFRANISYSSQSSISMNTCDGKHDDDGISNWAHRAHVSSGEVTIDVDIRVEKQRKSIWYPNEALEDTSDSKLGKLHSSSKSSDVTFIVGTKQRKFNAHKCILEMSSPYLYGLVLSKAEEIDDIDTAAATEELSRTEKAAALVFDEFDSTSSGSVPVSSFEDMSEALGEGFHGDEYDAQVDLVDPSKSGKITRSAFLTWYKSLVEGSDDNVLLDSTDKEERAEEEEKAKDAFGKLSEVEEGESYITVDQFGDLFESMGSTYCEEEHKKTLKRLKKDTNRIYQSDFLVWYIDSLFGDEDSSDDDSDEDNISDDEGTNVVNNSEGEPLFDTASASPDNMNVELLGVSEVAFDAVVKFLYTGTEPKYVRKNVNSAKDVLLLADKFDCTHLKLYAESVLAERFLDTSNAADMILFADAHSCALLKEAAMGMYATDPKTVRKTEGYSKLMESKDLVIELLDYTNGERGEYVRVADRTPEEDVDNLDVTSLRERLQSVSIHNVDGSKEMLVKYWKDAIF